MNEVQIDENHWVIDGLHVRRSIRGEGPWTVLFQTDGVDRFEPGVGFSQHDTLDDARRAIAERA